MEIVFRSYISIAITASTITGMSVRCTNNTGSCQEKMQGEKNRESFLEKWDVLSAEAFVVSDEKNFISFYNILDLN